jgi:group I intron endonuclease
MTKSGIYMIRNVINNKKYVGSTCSSNGFYKRWRIHKAYLRHNNHPNSHLQNAWNKYGEDSFEFMILEECEDNKLISREQYWISRYDTTNRAKGYNLKEAGSNGKGYHHTKEAIEKIRIAALKNGGRKPGFKIDEETRRKMINGHKNHPRINYKHSEDTKLKLSIAHKGKKTSEEAKRNLSNSMTLWWSKNRHKVIRQKASEETKKRMSESHKNIWAERNQSNRRKFNKPVI